MKGSRSEDKRYVLRKNFLKYVNVRGFAPESEFHDGCHSFILPNVFCKDLDLCGESVVLTEEWCCAVPPCGDGKYSSLDKCHTRHWHHQFLMVKVIMFGQQGYHVKASSSYGGKGKQFESYKDNFDISHCKHYGRKNHPSSKCWRKLDQKCEKCLKMGHHQRICKSNNQQKTVTQENVQQKNIGQVVDEEKEQTLILRDLFKELGTSVVFKVNSGNGEHNAVKGKDTVAIESISSTKLIKDVLFVPNIGQNLLSVGQLIQKGFKVIFESDKCLIKDANDIKVFKVKMKGKNFALDPMKEEQTTFSAINVHVEVWHKRLGHFNHTVVVNLQRMELVQGLPCLEFKIPNCRACQQGKQSRLPFKQSTWRATKKLQLIHTDVAGPHNNPSLNGNRMCWIYFLKFKSEVVGVFWQFKQWIETQSGHKIQALRSDNGKEYTSNQFYYFCKEARIEHQLTAPYTPQQNGVSVRKNYTIMDDG
ncbi:hypothetical protein CR513_43252, partial [Mucuna pruriens]